MAQPGDVAQVGGGVPASVRVRRRRRRRRRRRGRVFGLPPVASFRAATTLPLLWLRYADLHDASLVNPDHGHVLKHGFVVFPGQELLHYHRLVAQQNIDEGGGLSAGIGIGGITEPNVGSAGEFDETVLIADPELADNRISGHLYQHGVDFVLRHTAL